MIKEDAIEVVENMTEVKTWFIVTQVKSDRVVYFTDDSSYQAPTEGDWYYVSPYQNALPKGMTLRNCWRWRLRGLQLVDAGAPAAKDTAQTLIDSNKHALRQLLNDKIYALRQPVLARNPMGEKLREMRLIEAQELLAGVRNEDSLELLATAAAVRGIPLQTMAEKTIAAHEAQMALLLTSERLRDELAVAIDKAATQAELYALRERLMSDLVPHQNSEYAIKPSHTTPKQKEALPKPEELKQEQLRLRIQLRLKINALRREYVSDFLLDDIVLKHKGRLAQAVLQKSTQGLDMSPLISHAAAHAQSLELAAHGVLSEMDQTAKALLETEQMKEAMHVRIAAIKTFKDIGLVSKNIEALASSMLTSHANPHTLVPAAPTVPTPPRAVLRQKQREAVLYKTDKQVVQLPTDIVRQSVLSEPEFLEQSKRGLPFVMTGLVNQWPLFGHTVATLVQKFGHVQVQARIKDYVEKAFSAARAKQNYTLAEYMALVQPLPGVLPHAQSNGVTPELPPYLGNQVLPELAQLCHWPSYFKTWDEPRIWLGPKDTVTPLHSDYDDNLFAQVWGQKRFVLYPPHADKWLYTNKVNPVLTGSRFDPEAPDFQQYPLAKQAQSMTCTINAGEMLYLPAGWFHHVRSLDLSLSVNRWSRDIPQVLDGA